MSMKFDYDKAEARLDGLTSLRLFVRVLLYCGCPLLPTHHALVAGDGECLALAR